MSLNHQATRFTCSWPWSIAVVLCDGRVVCGCSDPYGQRVLGDLRQTSLHAIWTGQTAAALRSDLNAGGSAFCGDCPLKLPLEPGAAPPQRPDDAGALPSRLYLETTAACNVSCVQACCNPESGITRTRQAGMLDMAIVERLLDEAGPSLGRIDFFNYGEAFLHKRAVEMCGLIKSRHPHIYLYTSTNGQALTPESARELVHTGIDEVTFSLDGATQDTYERYRRRGNLSKAIASLRAMVDEKRRHALDVPVLNWRYILFRWNDNDDEMTRARTLAADVGVDRLSWEVTDHPEDSYSRRFVPGSADYARIRHEIWDDNNLGNAIPGATPRARIEVRTHGGIALIGRRGQILRVRTLVENLSTRPFPKTATYGRRLVRLGAQLCDRRGTLLNRDYARAWLPETLEGGSRAEVTIEVPVPPVRGRHQLKFDLVLEGVDWFESCGSQTTTVTLWSL